MIQVNSRLASTMTQFLKSGDLGPGARAEKPFLGEFGTFMLATDSVAPFFRADQVEGVDINSSANQVEIGPEALKSHPDFKSYGDFTRVRCDFQGPKEDPDQVTIHAKGPKQEQLIMATYTAHPDGSAQIRYVSADSSSDQPGWLLQGHDISLAPGATPFDANCKSQVLRFDPRPSLAD